MTSGRLPDVLRIYESALTREVAERSAYLDAECGADAALRREVEALLAEPSVGSQRLRDTPPAAPWTISKGSRLGPYEILAPLGAGGMGEVYKARDTRLGRDVAIKVLPSGVASDPARRRRFEHEARAVAALDHPHICALYDVGAQDGVDFLVMAFLDGETLAQRLRKGPLPLPVALEIGAQIADALAAAHKHGIVHRDLKPANVMLLKSGAKLLDFGLARLTESAAGVGESSTVSRTGAVVGTAPYMAPEQIEGRPADGRTDIFALGTVLYEMVTGVRAFEGESGASVMAAIMSREPVPMATRQPLTPPALERLVTKCLAKDPDQRWQSAHDAAEELRWMATVPTASGGPGASTSLRSRRLSWAAVVLALLGGLLAGSRWLGSPEAGQSPHQLVLALPDGVSYAGNSGVAFAPDGKAVVYAGTREDGSLLYWHDLSELDARPLAGTNGGSQPTFSPDGQWLAFVKGRSLVKVRIRDGRVVEGSPLIELVSGIADVNGVSWGDAGTIMYSAGAYSGLWVVSSEGGRGRQLTTPDPSKGEGSHRWPEMLPGGRAALFTVHHLSSRQDRSTIAVVSLTTGAVTNLVTGGSYPRYAPPNHLLYARLGAILAVPFDLRTLAVNGSPLAVMNNVMGYNRGTVSAEYAVSKDEAIVYAQDSDVQANVGLVWVDRDGRIEPVAPERRVYSGPPELAPDGYRLAAQVVEPKAFANIWTYDLHERRWQQLTFDGDNYCPVWSPAGDRLAFASNRDADFNIYVMSADGDRPPTRLTRANYSQFPRSWSADGRYLAYQQLSAGGEWYIWVLSMAGDHQARPWEAETSPAAGPAFSPDGHWLAYESRDSGRVEVYVRPFPGPGPRLRVSTARGGCAPAWSRDGRELFYLDENRIMAVAAQSGPSLKLGSPRIAFAPPFGPDTVYSRFGAISLDGYRVALSQPSPESATRHLVVLSNWAAKLSEKITPK